jgi:DHA2 family multidrug resistance protein
MLFQAYVDLINSERETIWTRHNALPVGQFADRRRTGADAKRSFAIGSWCMTYITSDWDFWELVWPQIFRGVGLMMAIIPINNVALGTLQLDKLKNASCLHNPMRNLGGAFGLAGLTTILNDRTDLHTERLHESITFARRPAVETLHQFTQHLQSFGSDAHDMALKQLYQLVHAQGVVMAFADVFLLLTVLFVVLTGLAW